MGKPKLTSHIVEMIHQAQNEEVYYQRFYRTDASLKGKNEFLMFIKPEITMVSDTIKYKAIVDHIMKQIDKFGLSVINARLLSAQYLKEYDIIAQHYGVINKIANDAQKNCSDQAKQKFSELYGVPFDKAPVYGGFQFLDAFDEYTPLTLNWLWQNVKFEKLAGGTYCMKLNFDGDDVYLVNGFHPQQIAHFTEEGRSIITLTLIGDLDWKVARNDFIGATLPDKAKEGSLRRYFFDNKDKLGLPAVNSSWNGVHLSAGPVEGLIELMRYNSNFQGGDTKTPDDFNFGTELLNTFSDDRVYDILSNISVQYKGETVSLFDITEEMNSDEALNLLKEVL